MRAAGPVRGAAHVALARDLHELLAVEEHVDSLLAVPSGDDDGGRPERVNARGRARSPSARARVAGQRARLRHVRGHDRRARHEQRPERLLGVLVEQPGAALGHHHRVEHHRRVRYEVERLAHGLDRLDGAEHPDLHGIHADVVRHGAHLLDDHLAAAAGTPP